MLSLALFAGTIIAPLSLPRAAAQPTISLIRTIRSSDWAKPSPDPMGLSFQIATGRLIVSDSEVEETRLYEGANVFLSTGKGRLKGTFTTTSFTSEPEDVSVGVGKRDLFFVDDNLDRVFRLRAGGDHRFGTKDDRVTSFGTRVFGSRDPEGLAYAAGSLFVTDGEGRKVYRIDRGSDGGFDGVPPAGDDTVTSFDTRALKMSDPEDVAYDPTSQHLFLVSRGRSTIVETTLDGDLVNRFDISFTGIVAASGLALVPSRSDPSVLRLVVADRGLDNNPHPRENDGRIFVLRLSR